MNTQEILELLHPGLGELDEKGSGGIWDLSAEICQALRIDIDYNTIDEFTNQEIIYNEIVNYIHSKLQ